MLVGGKPQRSAVCWLSSSVADTLKSQWREKVVKNEKCLFSLPAKICSHRLRHTLFILPVKREKWHPPPSNSCNDWGPRWRHAFPPPPCQTLSYPLENYYVLIYVSLPDKLNSSDAPLPLFTRRDSPCSAPWRRVSRSRRASWVGRVVHMWLPFCTIQPKGLNIIFCCLKYKSISSLFRLFIQVTLFWITPK